MNSNQIMFYFRWLCFPSSTPSASGLTFSGSGSTPRSRFQRSTFTRRSLRIMPNSWIDTGNYSRIQSRGIRLFYPIMCTLVTSFLHFRTRAFVKTRLPQRIRLMINSGGSLSPSFTREWHAVTGHNVVNCLTTREVQLDSQNGGLLHTAHLIVITHSRPGPSCLGMSRRQRTKAGAKVHKRWHR